MEKKKNGRPSFGEPYGQIGVYLPKDKIERLKKIAREQERPVTYIVRKMIEECFSRMEAE